MLVPHLALPPLNVAGVAITGMQIIVVATSYSREASDENTPYSKFAADAVQPSAVSSRTGMLFIYSPAAVVATVMATTTRPSLAATLLAVHFIKRVAEVLFVHRYSGEMPFAVGAGIGFYYAVCAGGISAVSTQQTSCAVAAVALFALGSLGNAWHHLLLARLRSTSSEGAKEYKPPTGGLFEYVSTPHYMFELIAWFGIALASEHLNALLVAFSMSSYLSGRSVATSKWNRKRFGKAWPATRGNMIPFLF